jgi:hypothetical protein
MGRKHSKNTAGTVDGLLAKDLVGNRDVLDILDLAGILENVDWVEREELERTGEWRLLDQYNLCLRDLLGVCVTNKHTDSTPAWVGIFLWGNSWRFNSIPGRSTLQFRRRK